MTDLEITKRGTIIDVKFPSQRVSLRAERLRDGGEKFTTELTVDAELSMNNMYREVELSRSNADMLNPNVKKTLINTLTEATMDYPYIMWGNIINDAFSAIMDKHREGVPATQMSVLDEHYPRSYALFPFFTKGVANLVWAPGGSGKSYLALLTSVLVDRGMSALGLRAPKGNVLYLDWEEEENVFKQRLFAGQKGLGVGNPETSGIWYKRMACTLANNIEAISRIVVDNNITYVVVDSVNPALGGKSNDSDAVEDYFDALRILEVTSVSIDHANKMGETTGKYQIYGSSFKQARARQMYEVTKMQESDSGELKVVMHHRKANDFGTIGPRGFTINFEMVDKYNSLEDDYEKQLDVVKFDTLGLGDDSGQLLRGETLTTICYQLVKAHGTMELEDLRERVSSIKDNDVASDAIELAVQNSNMLKLNEEAGTVGLAQEEKQWEVQK